MKMKHMIPSTKAIFIFQGPGGERHSWLSPVSLMLNDR